LTDITYEDLDEVEGRFAEQRRAKRGRARDSSLEWLGKCETDKQGNPFPNLANAMIALRSDLAVKNAFAYDEILCTAMLMHPIADESSKFNPRPVTDIDVSNLQEWLQLAGLPNIGKETVHHPTGS